MHFGFPKIKFEMPFLFSQIVLEPPVNSTYLNVLNVSPWLTSAGLMVAIIIVLELPPSESFRSHVRTESR